MYLIFDGNCLEAMTFYKKCLHADLNIFSFDDSPTPMPEEAKDRTMHARLSIGGANLMASDNMPGMPFTQGNNFSISIDCDGVEELDRLFNVPAEKGKITMPAQKTFWASRFCMLPDQFGIN